MTSHTHSLAEWLTAVSLGLIPLAALVLTLAFADPDWFDHTPSALLRTAVDRLLVEFVRAKGDVKALLSDAAMSLAALLALLSTAPEATS